jgi:hypothetical protein
MVLELYHCRPIYGTDCKVNNPALAEAWQLFWLKPISLLAIRRLKPTAMILYGSNFDDKQIPSPPVIPL